MNGIQENQKHPKPAQVVIPRIGTSQNENSSVKVIPTRYNNYFFRSRLEARWAVFFDQAGFVYEYEKEGYLLDSGKYLPDFWIKHPCNSLPEGSGYFVEIKGVTPNEKYLNKLMELARKTGHSTYLFVGPPWDFKCKQWNRSRSFVPSDWCDNFLIEDYGDGDMVYQNWILTVLSNRAASRCEDIEKAICIAKEARFEFGGA